MYINANLIHCRSNTQESYIDAYTETLSYLKHIILNLASIQPRFKQCTEEGSISHTEFSSREVMSYCGEAEATSSLCPSSWWKKDKSKTETGHLSQNNKCISYLYLQNEYQKVNLQGKLSVSKLYVLLKNNTKI